MKQRMMWHPWWGGITGIGRAVFSFCLGLDSKSVGGLVFSVCGVGSGKPGFLLFSAIYYRQVALLSKALVVHPCKARMLALPDTKSHSMSKQNQCVKYLVQCLADLNIR